MAIKFYGEGGNLDEVKSLPRLEPMIYAVTNLASLKYGSLLMDVRNWRARVLPMLL